MKTKPNSVWHFLTIAFILLANAACEKQEEATLPDLVTIVVSEVGTDNVTCGGMVHHDGGKTVTDRGIMIGKTEQPEIDGLKISMGAGTGFFEQKIENLDPGTTYYLNAYAENGVGVAFGLVKSFKTLGIITDVDGNSYEVVEIGNQTWMAENLKTSKYRNGDPIPLVDNEEEWFLIDSSGAFCYYNDDQNNNLVYGKLYNWHALADVRGICPEGFTVPDNEDWSTLVAYAGGPETAGSGLKHKGFEYWQIPNAGATNATGFTALPGGYRVGNGFFSKGKFANFWSATEHPENDGIGVYFLTVSYDNTYAYMATMFKRAGHSVRCIKKEN